ncbi:hypothetical protein FA15DRAFT_650951 [Coprinopsis marcescibilis]|uniref:Pal1-domain-containing protein n=1 Tax=Coprinopsis marcescibilis TaxID=230819 RepID=A0A5C3LC44_COPMA|nr:hypothetical protein FA15DRAFT_650951 [Coprinopsis marcescibilis]
MAAVIQHTDNDPFQDPSPHRLHNSKPSARMPTATTKSVPVDVREAVRDTVSYRHQQESTRTRTSRSNTASNSAAQTSSSRQGGRRSQSEDSGGIVEKPRSSAKSRPKKGSQHADVIDRLDFTGVGPMFHHDGPFDACAPSRNKHKTKAPMNAWTTKPEELSQQLQQGNGGAYPSAYAYQAFSNDYPEPPKKKVDAIAEAWGIHEPEPFEDFSAGGGTGRVEGDTPASSIYNGKDRQRPKEDREGRARGVVRRPGVPPPQPIFVPEADAVEQASGSPTSGSPGLPKRSKSLMHRIRKMRDAPNVPVSSDYDNQPSSPSNPTSMQDGSRPTHRSQNSFLGRFGVKTNQSAPTYPENETPEPYVFIDNQNQDKALPATPREIDFTPNSYAQPNQQASPQLGRKTSLMKKVGRVVRGR